MFSVSTYDPEHRSIFKRFVGSRTLKQRRTSGTYIALPLHSVCNMALSRGKLASARKPGCELTEMTCKLSQCKPRVDSWSRSRVD